MHDELTFGQWLQRRRKALHLTQQQLGALAGCAAETIRKYEADSRRPAPDILDHLAAALQVPQRERGAFTRFAGGDLVDLPTAVPATAAPIARPLHAPSNLPMPLTSLIGREHDVATVATLLQQREVRLLTLTGPGGVGKTRLCFAIAAVLRDVFVDGIMFVDLAPLTDPDLVLATIAQVLDVTETSGQTLLVSVHAHLRERHLLLVLDNFEQVLAAGLVVADLLQAASGLKMLVTSRQPLHLRGEHEVAVGPLALPASGVYDLQAVTQYDAVRLFIDRARATRVDFQVTNANARFVAEICARLDGLPLAIELAAARVKLLPPEALLKRLSTRLHTLTGGQHDLPARQQTIRATIDWSYALLEPAEQALFARLAVFAGGLTLEAAEAVCGENPGVTVLDGLQSLIEKSLIQQMGNADGEPRITMLETIREYALERIQESDEEPALRRRHTAYYLHMAEAAEPELRGQQQRMWLDQLEAEHDNLRAALAWSQATIDEQASGLRLVAALRWFWFYRGYLSEGRRWLATMLDMGERPAGARATPHMRDRARALGSSAALAWQQGDYQMARAQRVEAVSIWRELGDMPGLADELHYLGHLALDQRDTMMAHSAFEESLALYQALGNGFLIHALVGDLGMVAYHQGDYVTASRLLEESVTGLRTHGPTDTLGDHLNRLGDLARLAGDYKRAAHLYDESLALFRELRGNLGIASALHKLGYVAQYQGEYMRAQGLFAESLALQRQLGNKQGIAECLVGLAGLAGVQEPHVAGDQRAARLLAAAAGLLEAMNVPLAPADQADFDRAHAAARRESDEVAWTEAWARGQAMSLEQAIVDALGETAQT